MPERHGVNVSVGDLVRMRDEHLGRIDRMRETVKRHKEKIEDVVEEIVETTEMTGVAFLLGLADARYDGLAIVGVPAPLATAALGTVAGLLIGGKAAPHLFAVGKAGFSTMGVLAGQHYGDKRRGEAGLAPRESKYFVEGQKIAATKRARGELPAGGTNVQGEEITREELEGMQKAARPA